MCDVKEVACRDEPTKKYHPVCSFPKLYMDLYRFLVYPLCPISDSFQMRQAFFFPEKKKKSSKKKVNDCLMNIRQQLKKSHIDQNRAIKTVTIVNKRSCGFASA